jgi:hypothetical protein
MRGYLTHRRANVQTATITRDQFQSLKLITNSLTAKYQLDKPVDFADELKGLTALVVELTDSFAHDGP